MDFRASILPLQLLPAVYAFSESMIWGPLWAGSELRAGDKGEKTSKLLPGFGKEAGYGVSRATREPPCGSYMSPPLLNTVHKLVTIKTEDGAVVPSVRLSRTVSPPPEVIS